MSTEHLLPPALAFLAGAVLLMAGRRLFWMLIGVAGFLAGMWLALQVLGPDPGTVHLLLAVAAGLVGIVLARFFQRLAIGLAGFFLGGAAAVELFDLDVSSGRSGTLLLFAAAGFVGALLAGLFFEAALIVCSSWLGAMLVVDSLSLPLPILMLAVLFGVGIIVQSSRALPRRRAEAA